MSAGSMMVIGRAINRPPLDVIRLAMESRGIKNIELFEKSITDTDYSNGTAFFLFAPFPDRMEAVGNQLEVIGRRKRIRIMENKTRYFERYTTGPDACLRQASNKFYYWESLPR